MNTQVIQLFALAIQQHEGWFAGSHSQRNNNPGNLRSGVGQTGSDGSFAIFASYQDGFNALVSDITAKFTGNTRTGLGPSSTILQFFQVYAPSADSNDPATYAQSVVDYLNANLGTFFEVTDTLQDLMEFNGDGSDLVPVAPVSPTAPAGIIDVGNLGTVNVTAPAGNGVSDTTKIILAVVGVVLGGLVLTNIS
jgi:hypothetical protein